MQERIKKRSDDLLSLDMDFSFGENAYFGITDINKDFNVYSIEIQCDSDEEWDKKIGELKNELEKRKNSESIKVISK